MDVCRQQNGKSEQVSEASREGRCERKEWKVLCEGLTPLEAASYSVKMVIIHQGRRCNGGSPMST